MSTPLAGVGGTAPGVARVRAPESARPDRLFADPRLREHGRQPTVRPPADLAGHGRPLRHAATGNLLSAVRRG